MSGVLVPALLPAWSRTRQPGQGDPSEYTSFYFLLAVFVRFLCPYRRCLNLPRRPVRFMPERVSKERGTSAAIFVMSRVLCDAGGVVVAVEMDCDFVYLR